MHALLPVLGPTHKSHLTTSYEARLLIGPEPRDDMCSLLHSTTHPQQCIVLLRYRNGADGISITRLSWLLASMLRIASAESFDSR